MQSCNLSDDDIKAIAREVSERLSVVPQLTEEERRTIRSMSSWYNRATILIGNLVLGSLLCGLVALFVVGMRIFETHFREFFR